MPSLIGLLPVRNGALYLPLFLEQAQGYMDGIVALDDGSTDSTKELLRASSLVRQVLEHPVRQSYEGWDDLANRNELLQRLSIDGYTGWVLFLDADELMDTGDAQRLRTLILEDGLDQRKAYGFRVFRMVGDLEHFYKEALIVYRLFHFSPGHSILGERLHFEPIPHQISAACWQPTRLRIKHRSSMDAQLRRARFEKYLQADRDRLYQASYDNLLDEPVKVRSWSETSWSELF